MPAFKMFPQTFRIMLFYHMVNQELSESRAVHKTRKRKSGKRKKTETGLKKIIDSIL